MYTKNVTVKPGDFGPTGKVRPLAGLRGATNRTLSREDIIRHLAPIWPRVVTNDRIVLWQENPKDDFFYIISGAHRCYAASDFAGVGFIPKSGTTFKAEIREAHPKDGSHPDDDPKKFGPLVDQVLAFNRHAHTQSAVQELEIQQENSEWVSYAKKIGLDVQFASEQATTLTWKAIIAAHLGADRSEAKQALHPGNPTKDQMQEAFLLTPANDIHETLDIIQVWEQHYALPYLSTHDPLARPFRSDILHAFILIAREAVRNGNDRFLKNAPQCFLNAASKGSLPVLSRHRNIHQTAHLLLNAVNYKRTTTRLSIFGRYSNP